MVSAIHQHESSALKKKKITLAVLSLHCCIWAFSSCSEWGLLFIAVLRFLIAVASLVAAQGLQSTNSVATQPVRCSWTKDQTHVPCTGRQILNHWTIREVPIKPVSDTWFYQNTRFKICR